MARGRRCWCSGKENVGVRAIEPVGQYAVKLVFDDGHDTGLYSWKYLHELGRDHAVNWAKYLAQKSGRPRPSKGAPE